MSRTYKNFECIRCGNVFSSNNWKKDKAPKYCSKECRYPKIKRFCSQCKKEVVVGRDSKKAKSDYVFCNIDCANKHKYKNSSQKVVCDGCGITFEKPNSQLKKENYCSRKCYLNSFEDYYITKNCKNCNKSFETSRGIKEKEYCCVNCALTSKERKDHMSNLYSGVSLLERGFSVEEYNKHINRTIERNKENSGKTFEEIYGEEKSFEIKEKLSKVSFDENNNMHIKNIAKRNNCSIEEAIKFTPCYGRTKEKHPFYGKHHTIESKKKIIRTLEENGFFTIVSGYFDNIYFQGTWELKYIMDCIESNIKIKRYDKEPIEYEYGGYKRHYFPDFIINEEKTIEVKGMDKYNARTIEKMRVAKERLGNDFEVVFDVGQNKNPKSFINFMKAKYGDRLNIIHNPYKEAVNG